MAITESDIKLMASERLTDYDDAGGQMSAVVVADGVVNNLFPDISRLDRTYGRVNLRKAYAAIRTANKDAYYGAHAIITDAPDDPRVSVTMFTTGSYTDERTSARDLIESYLVSGPESQLTIYGNQLEGQRTITAYQREDGDLPEVGEVYVIVEEDNNGDPVKEQYVRVSDMSHDVQTFSISLNNSLYEFDRRVLTLEIGSTLRHTFAGVDVPSPFSGSSNVKLRTTTVADASRYYGIVPLAEAINPGDMTIKASSIYGQLVPSTQVESPVVDIQAGADKVALPAAASALFRVGLAGSDYNGVYHYPRSIMPGSLVMFGASYVWGTHSTTLGDDGNGALIITAKESSVSTAIGTVVGSVDYEKGSVSVTGVTQGALTTKYIEAIPAPAIADVGHTAQDEITTATRGYNYVKTLLPIPQPGTLTVDYMVLGKWYRLRDLGAGLLEDNSGGIGTIDYATGAVVATLAALPDTDSTVLYTWTTGDHYEERTGDALIESPDLIHTVAGDGIVPGTLDLAWTVGGVDKTASDDGAGNITGDASGRVMYGSGELRLVPTVAPDSGSLLSIDYSDAVRRSGTSAGSKSGSLVTLQLGTTIKPRSLDLSWIVSRSWVEDWGRIQKSANVTRRVSDNGSGGLVGVSGTVNYTTGEVVVTVEAPSTIKQHSTEGWVEGGSEALNGALSYSYFEDSITPAVQTDSVAFGSLELDLTPDTLYPVVPGSVLFTWGGKTYLDRAGTLYTDHDSSDNSATAVGTIDYNAGTVSIDTYNGGGSGSADIKALLIKYGQWSTDRLQFRTPGAPLRPGSFYFRANLGNGTLISATADLSGAIAGNQITGTINAETGVADIRFGETVADSSLSADDRAEIWYSADNIDGEGNIWRPNPIAATTAKFNAVVYSIMSLDADILGLDPVRLPLDGRVPIVRSGDVVVVHNTQTDALPSGLVANQVEALSRNDLDAAYLTDADGLALDAALYSVNKATGQVTMADPLDLTGYVEPLQAVHRQEDMLLVNEAEINGTIALVGPASRSYPAAGTFVSSALIFGDMASRAHHLFSQQTWSNVWADSRSGNPTTAQYNDVLFPVQINNQNSLKERWALVFTSITTFNIVGEVSGVIGSGNTSTDTAPINPVTSEPYFTVLAAGWGSGWSNGNVLRFNTDAANAPIWVARTTISGAPTAADDSFKIQIRGDAD